MNIKIIENKFINLDQEVANLGDARSIEVGISCVGTIVPLRDAIDFSRDGEPTYKDGNLLI